MARTFDADRVRQVQPVLARLARKDIGTSYSVEDRRNLHQHIASVGVGLLQVARELSAKVTEPALRDAGGQGKRRSFG